MLDIGVTQLGGSFGSACIGTAMLITTIGHDQGILIGGKNLGKISSVGRVVDGTRDMSVGIGDRAIDIEDSDFLGRDIVFEISEADVGEGTCKSVEAEEQGSGDEKKFFHFVKLA